MYIPMHIYIYTHTHVYLAHDTYSRPEARSKSLAASRCKHALIETMCALVFLLVFMYVCRCHKYACYKPNPMDLSFCASIYLVSYLSIYLPTCLSIYQSIYLYIYIYMYVYLSIDSVIYRSIELSNDLSIHLSSFLSKSRTTSIHVWIKQYKYKHIYIHN